VKGTGHGLFEGELAVPESIEKKKSWLLGPGYPRNGGVPTTRPERLGQLTNLNLLKVE
jgi:hypothetical protein